MRAKPHNVQLRNKTSDSTVVVSRLWWGKKIHFWLSLRAPCSVWNEQCARYWAEKSWSSVGESAFTGTLFFFHWNCPLILHIQPPRRVSTMSLWMQPSIINIPKCCDSWDSQSGWRFSTKHHFNLILRKCRSSVGLVWTRDAHFQLIHKWVVRWPNQLINRLVNKWPFFSWKHPFQNKKMQKKKIQKWKKEHSCVQVMQMVL